ncbi:hypothetical protein GALMADRAFT_142554 [Galerina marginata CBS 339.88]|uniref:Uncharacterized protein n=1 Tax=Galerina marginata (strain CBS 339.88) TaxID=685588 RepID=A0A067SYP7_GALM3|nr:hypothetical protein GALMADRAFT_142554 [Galerina marginata CBS 339.88]
MTLESPRCVPSCTPLSSKVNAVYEGATSRPIPAAELRQLNIPVRNMDSLPGCILVVPKAECTRDPRTRPGASEYQHPNGSPHYSHPAAQIAASAEAISKLHADIGERIKAIYQLQSDQQTREATIRQRDLEEQCRKAEEKCDRLHEQLISGVKIRSEERGRWEQERKELLRRIEEHTQEISNASNFRVDPSLEKDLTELRETLQKERNERHLERKNSSDEILRYQKRNSALEEKLKTWEVECKKISEALEKERKEELEKAMAKKDLNRRACIFEQEKKERMWQEERLTMQAQLKQERKARLGLTAALSLQHGEELGRKECTRKRKRID